MMDGGRTALRKLAVAVAIAAIALTAVLALRLAGASGNAIVAPAPRLTTASSEAARANVIYTYWEGDMSPCAAACINSMRHHNPGWEVRVLGRESGGKADTVTQRADRARIEAMVLTGGVWLDASCLCVAPVEAWVGEDPRAVYGFVMVGNEGDCMENWAFAARNPRNEFLTAWRDEFAHAQEQGIARYCREPDVSTLCERFTKLYASIPYLTMHLTWLRVRAALPDAPVVLHPPTPFHFQEETEWDDGKFAQLANTAGSLEPFDGPFVKFRGVERALMDDLLRATAPRDVAEGSVLEYLVRMGDASRTQGNADNVAWPSNPSVT